MGEEAEVDAWRQVLRALVLAAANNVEAAQAIVEALREPAPVSVKGGKHGRRAE